MAKLGSSADPSGGDASAPAAANRRSAGSRLLRALVTLCGGAFLLVVLGFFWFAATLPTEEVQLDRNADGIVALTGGASRVIDAIELLAAKRGHRLLISGANPSTNAKDISRLHPEYASVVHCCVDFDRSLNTLGNAIETRKWATGRNVRSLIVVTSGYHMPRAILEIGHQLPGVALIAFPVFSDQLRAEPWWSNAGTARIIVLEYLKYLYAYARIGMRLSPDESD